MNGVPFNDLLRQYNGLKSEIDGAIATVIEESSFVRGRFVEEYEEQFARMMGVKHCVSCANGTDAIYIALKALGVGAGDDVITTAHTWISSSETITQAGANVVFCDTGADSFLIDYEEIERKLTPATKGIIVVHLYGQPVDMPPIMALAKQHGLWVVEDCAQAHLAESRGQIVGSFGDIATFSFYPGKNLGAMGDAGAIVTNSTEMSEWMAMYARHGGKGNHVIEGINSRMDGMQAAILLAKLPSLPRWTERRREIAAMYDIALEGVSGVKTPIVLPERKHVYHLYVVRVKNRDKVRESLAGAGVQTVVNYPIALPNCDSYAYLGHSPDDFPNSTANQNEILSIPIFPEMMDVEIDYVVDALKSAVGK